MTTTLTILLWICLIGFVCGWVNATLGMGYGTILSPILLLLSLDQHTAVPAVLISQGISAFFSSYYHHGLENVDFSHSQVTGKMSNNFKDALWIAIPGVIAVCLASYMSVRVISKETLSTYIGTIVCIMGVLVLIFAFIERAPSYSPFWMKIVAFVAALNKGSSGGGFGPLTTGGQVVSGQEHKSAVGVTMFAEGPICIAGFLAWWYLKGVTQWDVMAALTLGAVGASKLGAHTTKRLSHKYLPVIIGCTLIFLGSFVLLKRYGIITISISM
jgi:uncharacterized protein